MIIDSHVHLWRLSRGDYGWLSPDLTALYRDFEPGDLAPLMATAGVTGGVVVQAAETEAETRHLLDLADRTDAILAVVGWTDFAAADAPATITRLARAPKLKGLRPMLQDLEDDDFILRRQADAALTAMGVQGLRLDALVRPRHLTRLIKVRERHPDLPIVIDHIAKPDIAGGEWDPWAGDLARVAADGMTCCKLSGLITEAGGDWTAAQIAPYARHVLKVFGPDRVMWGSDWPVALLAGDYQGWLAAARSLLDSLSPADRALVMGGTARRFYGLG